MSLLAFLCLFAIQAQAGVIVLDQDSPTLTNEIVVHISSGLNADEPPPELKRSSRNELDVTEIRRPSNFVVTAIVHYEELSFGSIAIDSIPVTNDLDWLPPELDGLIKPPQENTKTIL